MHEHREQPQGSEPTQEFLTFTLGHEEYAIDILRVQEIRGYDQVTAIANSPAFIKGVINLRGAVVPVIDLSARFGGPASTVSRRTCIVIVDVCPGTTLIVTKLLFTSTTAAAGAARTTERAAADRRARPENRILGIAVLRAYSLSPISAAQSPC